MKIRASAVFDQEYGSRKRRTLWTCFLLKMLQDHQSPKHQVVDISHEFLTINQPIPSNLSMQNCINTFVYKKTTHISRSPRGPKNFPQSFRSRSRGSLFFLGDANSGGEALFDVMGSLVSFHMNEINLS